MQKQTQPDEQDQPWKQIFRLYFREGIELLFPQIACEVDWSRPIDFLDKEFSKIAPDARTGKRVSDQLVKVYRKRGKPIFLLIHVEIQASRESHFARRIFTYALRIFDYFGQPATSLVILCDADEKWRPESYGYSLPGTSLNFEFSTVKLLDYRDRWEDLEASHNASLWDMVQAIKLIQEFVTSLSYEDYLDSRRDQMAVERGLEILGKRHVEFLVSFSKRIRR